MATKRTNKNRGAKRPPRNAPAAGPAQVSGRPLAAVTTILMRRGGREYVHHFTKQLPQLHRVDGREGVLVLVGNFKLDAQGFIQD